MINDNNLRQWLVFNQLHISNPADIYQLIQQQDNNIDIFSMSAKELIDIGFSEELISKLQKLDWLTIDDELEWSTLSDHHIITFRDKHYPALLREIKFPPLVIYVMGHPEDLNKPQLAIVGSRNPTPIGEEIAQQFAQYLAKSGFIITSGLAIGIDAAGHMGALSVGRTIAVLGSGLEHIYPSQHKGLVEQIRNHGAVISEFPLKISPKRENFPRRNRIISGLSLGVLVVEASLHSGSLITAHLAMEQGHEVFAIPGSIHNPLSRGCHKLIREGAKLVETAQDILEELGSLFDFVTSTKLPDIHRLTDSVEKKSFEETLDFFDSDPDYIKLLSMIGYEPTAIDTIILRSGFIPKIVSSMLLSLELRGYVKSLPGGYCRIKK